MKSISKVRKLVNKNITIDLNKSTTKWMSAMPNVRIDDQPMHITNDVSKCFRYNHVDGFVRTSPYEPICMPNVNSIYESVWRNLSNWQNKIATICSTTGRQYTYAKLRDHCATLAGHLRNTFQLAKGETICICLPNTPEYPIIMLGAMEAGQIVTTMNPTYLPDEMIKQLIDSDTKLIFCTTENYSTIQCATRKMQKSIKIICLRTNIDAQLPNGAIDFLQLINTSISNNNRQKPIEHNLHDTALLLYSSGTTGLPKGVMQTNLNIISNCEQFQAQLPMYDPIVRSATANFQEIIPNVIPFFHTYGLVAGMLTKLAIGAKIVTVSAFEPASFVRTLNEYGATFMNLAPPLVLFMSNSKMVQSSHLTRLRTIMTGAAPLGQLDAERFAKKAPHIEFIQGYGLTECSPLASISPIGSRNHGSIGVPAANTEIKIVNVNNDDDVDAATNTDRGLGANCEGEIWIRGPQVMKGYLNNSKATDATITKDKWLRTGDLGHYDESGYLYVTDRLKELIKCKGFQVAPAELEEILRNHPAISDAGVVGVAHQKFGEAPCAFVVRQTGIECSELDIKEYVAQRVASYKRLTGGVQFIEAIPKNPSGKILRRRLKELIVA